MDGIDTTTILPMCTFAGKRFYPLDPSEEDINIVDIAHGLSNVCRYGGMCKEFYSVAQHSVLCSLEASYENKKWALMHDASEAYIGDIIHPLKATPQYESYRIIEENLMEAIANKFRLPLPIPEEVHEIDMLVRHTEMRDFGSVPSEIWETEDMLPYVIKPLPPVEAKILFLDTFARLFGYDSKPWRYYP